MKATASVLLLSALMFAAVGCATETNDETIDQAAAQLSTQLSPAELAATKAALRAVANANMTRSDNFAAVRAQVDPIVDKLARHFGTRPATDKVPLVAGAWRQLWSDYPYPMSRLLKMDPRQVYQVVSDDGHYWNIGDQRALGIFGMTGVLRGQYEPNGTKLNIEFTDVGYRFGRVSRKENLVSLADGLESGERFYLPIPGGGQAPRGPVGIRGTLETLYVDKDLRIERGTQEGFVDASGRVLVEGYGPKLFILDRVTIPVK